MSAGDSAGGGDPHVRPRAARDLSDRQQAVLAYLSRCMRHGRPPSMREIAGATGLTSTSSVDYQLRVLERKGFVRRNAARSARSYVPVDWPRRDCPEGDTGTGEGGAEREDVRRVPLLRQLPTTVHEPVAWTAVERVLPLPQELLGAGELLAVRMESPAMTGAGIRSGDILTVRRQSSAAHGDVVAARVGDETLIRRLSASDSQVRLVACNPGYPPIHAAAAVVLGRVVAVMRSL